MLTTALRLTTTPTTALLLTTAPTTGRVHPSAVRKPPS
jgi:hypothetical protein